MQKAQTEKEILNHTSDLFKAYKDMKVEMETVLKERVKDYKEAEEALKEAQAEEDGEEQDVNVETKSSQHNVAAGQVHDRDGDTADDVDKGRTKKKVRVVKAPEKAHHAGGDNATGDRRGIITGIPGKEQVKRAEAMAKQGRRA